MVALFNQAGVSGVTPAGWSAQPGSRRRSAGQFPPGSRSERARIRDLATAPGSLGAWVRLHYVYTYPHVDELVPLMAEGLVLPYLDAPFQHASPRVLRLMRRPAGAEDNLQRIRTWRATCPELTVRSTFIVIVGFPGETDDDFEALLDFLEAAGIDRADTHDRFARPV